MDALYEEEYDYNPEARTRFPGEVEPTEQATLAMPADEVASLVPTYVQVNVEYTRAKEELTKVKQVIQQKKAELTEMGYSHDDVMTIMFEVKNLSGVDEVQEELEYYMECLSTKISDLLQQMHWLNMVEPDQCPGDEFLDGEDDDWFYHYL